MYKSHYKNNYNNQNNNYNNQNNNYQNNNLPQLDKKEFELKINGETTILNADAINRFFPQKYPVTENEAKLLVELCKAQGLNPFLKEAHILKYTKDQPAQLIVDYKMVQDRVVKDPAFDGFESGIVVERNGEMHRIVGGVRLQNDIIIGGWATVRRKGVSLPITTTVALSEFAGMHNGKLNKQWANKTAFMIEKVAKTHAFRASFPKNIQGLYIDEEMQKARESVNEVNNNNYEAPPKKELSTSFELQKQRNQIKKLFEDVNKITGEYPAELFKKFDITDKTSLEELQKKETDIVNYILDQELTKGE